MIIVYGTVCVDRIHRINSLPAPGGYAEVLSVRETLGGEALNTAWALSQWGDEVRLFGNPLGDEQWLNRVRTELRYGFPNTSAELPVCDIYVSADGDRTMFGWGFAAMESDVSGFNFEIPPGAWFTSDPNHGESAIAQVRRAASAGARVYVQDFIEQFVPPGAIVQTSTDWIGERNSEPVNKQAARELSRKRQSTVVLTDGGHGTYVAAGESVWKLPAYRIPEVVDSTGAGDSFRAGMLHGLHRGWPIAMALAFASGAGALNCLSEGANAGLPKVSDVQALMNEQAEVTQAFESVPDACIANVSGSVQ